MFCIAKENKSLCNGCTACVNVCPQECIKMNKDENGFFYPIINEIDCISCGICYEVCPENNHEALDRTHIPTTCFAAKHIDKNILMQSSSGGAFAAITQCFNNDTYVFGACYDENMQVIHNGIKGINSYKRFQKSKYVQSNLHSSYFEIKNLIQKGNTVIFSGTPCQIAGIKRYIKTPSERLIFIELLCHGASSPGVFKDYIKYLEDKFQNKVVSFNFRDKSVGRGMWRDFLTKIQFQNGKVIFDKYDLYTQGFLANIFTRERCLTCPYACTERIGDIVIGDFWGLEKYDPNLCADTGVSLVIPITQIGRNIVKQLSQYMQLKELDIKYALQGNSVLYQPTKTNSSREKFFELYKEYSINEAILACIQRPSLLKRIFSRLPEGFKTNLRKLIVTFKMKI